MSVHPFTAPIVLSLLLTASAAHAAPIFIQNARDTAFPSDREFDTLIADDFSIAADDIVRSVSWLDVYAFDDSAPAVDDFEIRFYDDAAGSPGALLQTFAVGNAVARTSVGGVLGPFIEYRYTADLGAGFGIDAATTYWLMIANDTTGDNDNWYWAAQAQGGNAHLSVDAGSLWTLTLTNGATYFILDNANVSVPEPVSFLLIGIGVAAAVRRKRQHQRRCRS